jgi:hypothetical protein
MVDNNEEIGNYPLITRAEKSDRKISDLSEKEFVALMSEMIDREQHETSHRMSDCFDLFWDSNKSQFMFWGIIKNLLTPRKCHHKFLPNEIR